MLIAKVAAAKLQNRTESTLIISLGAAAKRRNDRPIKLQKVVTVLKIFIVIGK